MFKKLAYFTCWLLVICLVLVFCFTVGLWQNWSTSFILLLWLSILLVAVLLWSTMHALIVAIKEKKIRRWLKKYGLSRREYVLFNHWKSGASIIRRIYRQRAQLPWYLLVGDRCGKSTLLASAGLPRFNGDSDDSISGPTRTLKWWFFRQICVLDLSSNFINGTPTFRQGWRKLAHWCTRIPAPAGIIVALPISALMSDDRTALHTLMRQQRALIEPLVSRFGGRLPLFIMITQSDHFPGFSLWHQQLSVSQRQQPLGYSWHTPPHIDGQDELALQPLFAALRQGMSHVRLSMTRPDVLSAQEYSLLLNFPEAFASLEPALRYAVAALCEPNAYFSHISLNSIWFSATETQAENRGRRTSVFVHDMLATHLHSLSLRDNSQHWYQRIRSKWCSSVVLIACTLWLVFSASFSFQYLQSKVTQLSPDALAIFLAKDEQQLGSSWYALPFMPLLTQQHQLAESRLIEVPSSPKQEQAVLAQYQQQVLTAEPAQQRTLILQLANVILTWQQMRDGVSLNILSQTAPEMSSLQQRIYLDTLSPLTILALERSYMQRPDGARWLLAAQRLLERLVNHDPELNWLVAPTSTLPALQASAFWPSLPETLTLSGIWTRDGEVSLNDWMAQIEHAIGRPQSVFRQARARLPTQRQDAWLQYLTDVAASLASEPPSVMPRRQLLAVGLDQSQAMIFAAQILRELDGVPASQAQPWLEVLRKLELLAITDNASALIRRAIHLDKRVRQSLTAWLQGTSTGLRTDSASLTELAWHQWKNTRNRAATEAIAQGKPDAYLMRGLFSTAQNDGEPNPLTGLIPAISTLQEHLSPQSNDAGIAAVWLLYRDDARRLLANAMAQSACWLNTQWKNSVIWPLNKDTKQLSHEELQALSQQSVSDFLRGPASTLLVAEKSGLVAADYAGMKVPLTADFLRLTRQTFPTDLIQDIPQRASTRNSDRQVALQAKIAVLTQQQSALEKESWKITVSSQPATVPGGARVIPTGTRLTLRCLKGDQQLSSMNFAEKRDFIWQPGQCSGVTLDVIFPDFIASYQLNGHDAWPWLVNRFTTDGEALFDSNDFGDNASLLLQLGIKHILVRFAVSNPEEMESAWQSWSDLTNHINDLKIQIINLNNSPEILNPISALPEDIARCQ